MNRATKFPSERSVPLFVTLLLAAVICVNAPCATGQQKHPDFETLVSDAAHAIQESPESTGQNPKVLVFDFRERYTQPTELAHELALQFADALKRKAQGFVVLTQDEFRRTIANPDLPSGVFYSASAMRCYAAELGPAMLVEGDLRVVPDGAMLEVTVWSAKVKKSIFDESGIFPMTPAMDELAQKPEPAATPLDLSTRDNRVWVNPSRAPIDDSRAIQSDRWPKGYIKPACRLCPNPQFSNEAVKARFYGTVVLQVQILDDGSVAKASVVRGLPCGLTDKAFDAVKNWSFEPAKSPDGKPVASDVSVEVTFRLY